MNNPQGCYLGKRVQQLLQNGSDAKQGKIILQIVFLFLKWSPIAEYASLPPAFNKPVNAESKPTAVTPITP